MKKEEEEQRKRESKEDMNKPSDVSTINVNGHEKMGAFKSKSLATNSNRWLL